MRTLIKVGIVILAVALSAVILLFIICSRL